MKKRIVLSVPTIQLKNFMQRESCRAAWIDLLFGCISMNGISIEIDDHLFPGESWPHISHNDAMADMRLIDVPIHHHGKRQPKNLLYEHLAIGMNEFINGTHYEEVKKFLNKETDHLSDSHPFKPEAWDGKSLRIPVDFISVYGISGGNGIARAHVRIGHHIVLWNMQVYPTFKPDQVIFDERIIEEVKKILARKRATSTLKYCAQNKAINHEDKFMSKIPGCKKKIPPVRFY
jgi:hypothetical protein